MNLFNETKNKYYDIISDLIFILHEKKDFELKELYSLMGSNFDNNIELKNSILNKNGSDSLFILDEKKNSYTLTVDSTLPIIPTYLEKLWLKYMLKDNKAGLFLDKNTIEKLLTSLEKYEDIIQDNIIIKHKNNVKIKNYDELKTKIRTLITAIKTHSTINYSYVTKNGVLLKEKISIPYKIEYSLKKDRFYLISFSTEEKRPIKSILDNIIDLKIVEYEKNISMNEIKESINAKKSDKYLILEIQNINNVKERAFLTFTCYSKTAKFIEKKDIYELKILYYSFEEKEVLKKVFSLGKGVIVKEPVNIRNEIIKLIEDSLSLYD